MVSHDVEMAAPACVAHTAGTHGYEVFLQVAGADVVHIDQSQQLFEVGCNFIACVEKSVFQIQISSAVEGRMRRHKSQSHPTASKIF